MANDYFSPTSYLLVQGTTANATDVNTPLNALEVSFDKLPAPHASAPATKGFSEVFTVLEPTANTHPLSLGGFINNTQRYATSGGSANAYTLTLSPAQTAYMAGMTVLFKANHANTGASTIDINSLGAKSIKNPDGTALAANSIPSGAIVCLTYDGTNFQIRMELTSATAEIATHAALTATHGATGAIVGTTNTQTLTNKTLTSPVISSISNTGTLTLPTSTDTLVGRATTDTLTNKTLTSPVISSISNTGTITLPTSTDTLVGRATTDTFSNKTFSDTITSTVATGTAPLIVASTTVVANLNADLLDGYNTATATAADTVVVRDGSGDITTRVFYANVATGTAPLIIDSTTKVSNLNVDSVDGVHTKIVDIGDWNMDSDITTTVAHGMADYKNIRAVFATIRRDDDARNYDLLAAGSPTYWDATDITLQRGTAGVFDSTDFDSTSFNRGWITIQYVD